MPSFVSKTANTVLTPMPVSATWGSDATGTVRDRGMPLLSHHATVTPATPAPRSCSTSSLARSAVSPTAVSCHRPGVVATG